MKFSVTQVSSKAWIESMSEDAFKIAFGFDRPSSLERFDFALIAVDSANEFSGFITCKEMDAETLYWQFGGSMPNYKKSISVFNGYMCFVNWARERYKQVTTRIENGNTSMIKLALGVGFKIVGTYTFKDKIYLELVNEF